MTPRPIAAILESPITWFVSRLFMTFMFWWEGLHFLLSFGPSIPVLNVTGMQPAWIMPAITLAVLLIGSILILIDKYLWLGAGMLSTFTALTVLLVHRFWAMTGAAAVQNRLESEEHLAVIGGMIALCMVSHFRSQMRRTA